MFYFNVKSIYSTMRIMLVITLKKKKKTLFLIGLNLFNKKK